MRASKLLLQIKPAGFGKAYSANKSFREGATFEKNFPTGRRTKAWEGQDRDEFFRKNYAHVHARQVRERDGKDRFQDKRTSFNRGTQSRGNFDREWKDRSQDTRGKFDREYRGGNFDKSTQSPGNFDREWKDRSQYKSASFDRGSRNPGSYARDMPRKSIAKIPTVAFNEYIYGTSSVLAALSGNKRSGFGMLYTTKSPSSADLDIIQAANARKIPIEYDTPKIKLNELTSNGVHNGYVIRVRPLNLPQVESLLFNSLEPAKATIDEGTDTPEVNNTETEHKSNYGMVEFKFEQPQRVKHDVACPKLKHNAVGIYIDEVTDPHNIGAIIRSAQFLGADFAIVSNLNCAKLSPVVSKVSAGALETFPIYSCEAPLKLFEKSALEGWNIIASVPETGALSSLKTLKPSELNIVNVEGPSLLVVGSEGEGLRKSLLQRCTHCVSIANGGDQGSVSDDKPVLLDSLNVSVASALLLSRFLKD